MKHSVKVILRHALITAIGMFLLLSADYLGFFFKLDLACLDSFFRLRGARETDSRIVIATVDERTLAKLGRWPLERRHYASLLDRLERARAVGFDIIMSEPSRDDALLSSAASRHGAVVFPAYLERRSLDLDTSRAASPRHVGHIHVEPDIDGVVRKVHHTLAVNGRGIPSFTSSLYRILSDSDRKHDSLPQKTAGASDSEPLTQSDARLINYYGPPGTFPMISVADILDGRLPAAFFTRRVVLVGVTAEGIETGALTPFSQERNRMSGIETHANILNNLLHDDSIREIPDSVRWLLSACLSVLAMVLFLRTGSRWMFPGWLLITTCILTFSYWLFSAGTLWVSPVIACILIGFMMIAAHFFRLEQAGRDLQEAKDDWEESFNTINDGIVLMDPSGSVTRSNTAATGLSGQIMTFLSSRSEELAAAATDRIGPADAREIDDPGSGNCYEIKSLPRKDHEGRPAGFVHVVQDMSARKRAEEEKELIRSQLIQSQKMESVGRLAAGITHDFNNLLTAILGFSELAMIRMAPDDPLREHLRIIHESGIKAARLTRQLLTFSRKQVMDLQVVNLGTIVTDLSKILGRLLGEDVLLKLVTVDTSSFIKADPGQLEQVIMNLAVNARDAMPDGGTLTIETDSVVLDETYARRHFQMSPGHYVTLTMTDSGVGMGPEVRGKIFEPFFTTKKEGEGTGLGLSTVYGIVKQLSGHIHVYSEVGSGSVFTIYFPACSGGGHQTREESFPSPVKGTEHCLVAEDEPMVRQLIADTLIPCGYEVELAGSCAEALEIMERSGSKFHLLLTDVIMPENGGKELAEAFRQKYPDGKVIFMSGYSDEIVSRRGLEKISGHFIQKPLIPNRLMAKLREVLDGSAG